MPLGPSPEERDLQGRARELARAAMHGPGGGPFPDPMLAAQAKLFAAEAAVGIVGGALQPHGARGYPCDNPTERMARGVRMSTTGGGAAPVLRTFVASKVLDWKLPQGRGDHAAARPEDAG